MKEIFYIVNARIPTEKAHGIQIINTCQGLSNAGANLTLILPNRFNKNRSSVAEYYGINPSFSIVFLPTIDAIIFDRWLGSVGYWIQLISFYTFAFFYLLFNGFFKSVVIYSRDPIASLLRPLFPVYLEIHSLPENKKRIFSWFLKRASGLISISEGVQEDLFLILPNRKSLVVHDAVDLGKFNIDISREEARHKLGLKEDFKMVLYTGHLYGWKGAGVLAESAGLIDSNTRVYFVGGNPKEVFNFKSNFKDLIESGQIVIIGPRPHSEIPVWLKAADILVLPNIGTSRLSSLYTSPIKLFEYAASRRPVVASDLPSLRHVLNDSQALFFKSGDSQDLADKIRILLKDVDLMKSLSDFAYNIALDNTWNKRAERILNYIKNG